MYLVLECEKGSISFPIGRNGSMIQVSSGQLTVVPTVALVTYYANILDKFSDEVKYHLSPKDPTKGMIEIPSDSISEVQVTPDPAGDDFLDVDLDLSVEGLGEEGTVEDRVEDTSIFDVDTDPTFGEESSTETVAREADFEDVGRFDEIEDSPIFDNDSGFESGEM